MIGKKKFKQTKIQNNYGKITMTKLIMVQLTISK